MAATMLDKPLSDLRREVDDLRRGHATRDYDTNRLSSILGRSRESLREAGMSQQQLLERLQQFDISLAEINEILRANSERRAQLDQQQQSGTRSLSVLGALRDNRFSLDNSVEVRAKLMELNAEALECRAAAVQLQQEAQIAVAKAAELERRAKEELVLQELERKRKQEEAERARAAEQERQLRLEEEQRRQKVGRTEGENDRYRFAVVLQEAELQQKREQERRLAAAKTQQPKEEDYSNYVTRE